MNIRLAADACEKISEGFAALALAIESPSADLPSAAVEQPAAAEHLPAPAALAGNLPPSFEELPPEEMFAESLSPKEEREILSDVGLGYCPKHRKAWSVKAAGVSKNGKPYKAFFKCSERDADGYCNEKPVKAWVDSHQRQLEGIAA